MNTKVVLLVLLLAVTTIMVCRSDDVPVKDESWTEWAKDKLSGAFKSEQVKDSAQSAANDIKDVASGSADYASEKAVEAEEAAADAAKQLSEKGSN